MLEILALPPLDESVSPRVVRSWAPALHVRWSDDSLDRRCHLVLEADAGVVDVLLQPPSFVVVGLSVVSEPPQDARLATWLTAARHGERGRPALRVGQGTADPTGATDVVRCRVEGLRWYSGAEGVALGCAREPLQWVDGGGGVWFGLAEDQLVGMVFRDVVDEEPEGYPTGSA